MKPKLIRYRVSSKLLDFCTRYENMVKNKQWITQKGEQINIEDMTDDHLVSVYRKFGYTTILKEILRRYSLYVQSVNNK